MMIELTFVMTARLIAVALIFQSIEMIMMLRQSETRRVWAFENFEPLFNQSFMLPAMKLIRSPRAMTTAAGLEILISVALILQPSALLVVAVAIVHLLICMRFGGSVNGGSDAMTFVVLTGLIFSSALRGPTEVVSSIGLYYIGVFVLVSYGLSGIAKLRQSDWRTGRAIPEFMKRSFFADIRDLGHRLDRYPAVKLLAAWATIAFEIAIVFAPLSKTWINSALAAAAIFHFTIYFLFGLNRFFWVWMSAWPSVLFLSRRFL